MWKVCLNNPSFEVSNQGVIRNVKTKKIRKAQTLKTGYSKVSTWLGTKTVTLIIHREVAKAFIPNPNKLPQVNHIDGNKLNNHVDNLEWVTESENVKHAYTTGLMPSSKNSIRVHKSRKMTVAIANNLRNDFAAGLCKSDLCIKYGISMPTLNRCLRGDTY